MDRIVVVNVWLSSQISLFMGAFSSFRIFLSILQMHVFVLYQCTLYHLMVQLENGHQDAYVSMPAVPVHESLIQATVETMISVENHVFNAHCAVVGTVFPVRVFDAIFGVMETWVL